MKKHIGIICLAAFLAGVWAVPGWGGLKEVATSSTPLEEKIENIIRDYGEAIEKWDVEKALSFFAEDATLVTPEGTFKGKEELRRYLMWSAQSIPDLMVTDTGIGLMVKGNKAVYEHVYKGTIEGVKCEWLAICVYELSDEKIQHLRSVYDRLSTAKQAVRERWLAKIVINYIVKRTEKGLR